MEHQEFNKTDMDHCLQKLTVDTGSQSWGLNTGSTGLVLSRNSSSSDAVKVDTDGMDDKVTREEVTEVTDKLEEVTEDTDSLEDAVTEDTEDIDDASLFSLSSLSSMTELLGSSVSMSVTADTVVVSEVSGEVTEITDKLE